MFCPKCGASVNDGTAFCAKCGAQLSAENNPQPQPQYQQPQYQQPQYQPPQYQRPMAQEEKMGWFKFLIYFGLFAGAVLNFINGLQLLTGDVYEGAADLVYAVFSDLEALDKLVAIAMMALAAFGIYARFRLSGFYANGPKMLNLVYIASLAVSLIYLIGVIMVVGDIGEDAVSTYIGNVIGSVVAIVINTKYFKNREHLFVN